MVTLVFGSVSFCVTSYGLQDLSSLTRYPTHDPTLKVLNLATGLPGNPLVTLLRRPYWVCFSPLFLRTALSCFPQPHFSLRYTPGTLLPQRPLQHPSLPGRLLVLYPRGLIFLQCPFTKEASLGTVVKSLNLKSFLWASR